MTKSILGSLMSSASMLAVAHAPDKEGNITMADLAPYYVAYKAKYGDDCTLSVDIMEELLGNASSDDALLEAMHEAMTSSDEDDDRSDVAVRDETPGSAYSYAVRMDAGLERDLSVLADAAIQNKRGGAVIMLDLFRVFGKDTIEQVWPKPGTWKPGSNKPDLEVGANEPWDNEETSVPKADGSTGKGRRSFYQELVELSPQGKRLVDEKYETSKIVGDLKASKPLKGAIAIKLSTIKGAITRAVNLAKKMAFVNEHTGMDCSIIMDVDDKGNEVVTNSNNVIFIRDKKSEGKLDVVTLGQFLAFKVTEGATYLQITGTTTRKPRAGETPVEIPAVNSIDAFDKCTAVYATFFDEIKQQLSRKDAKAYNALLTHLNSAGTDDLLLSLNDIMNFIEGLLSKPGIEKRLGALIADGAKPNANAKEKAA